MTELPIFLAAAAEGGGIAETLSEGFGINWPFFIGQLINFVAVVLLIYFLAYKPILRVVQQRQEKIDSGLDYAEEMKQKLADAEKTHEETLRKASAEAQEILKEAKAHADKLQEERLADAHRQAESILERGQAAVEAERQRVMEDVREEVSRLVLETTRRVLDRELSDEEKSAFTDRAAREMSGSLL
jgi:F-type H+-transporting ATPase subunit b